MLGQFYKTIKCNQKSGYPVYVDKIYKASKKAVMERLETNRSTALRASPSGEIAVKFDGTYQTRGFSSKVAVVWISNADTDEIFDF